MPLECVISYIRGSLCGAFAAVENPVVCILLALVKSGILVTTCSRDSIPCTVGTDVSTLQKRKRAQEYFPRRYVESTCKNQICLGTPRSKTRTEESNPDDDALLWRVAVIPLTLSTNLSNRFVETKINKRIGRRPFFNHGYFCQSPVCRVNPINNISTLKYAKRRGGCNGVYVRRALRKYEERVLPRSARKIEMFSKT